MGVEENRDKYALNKIEELCIESGIYDYCNERKKCFSQTIHTIDTFLEKMINEGKSVRIYGNCHLTRRLLNYLSQSIVGGGGTC